MGVPALFRWLNQKYPKITSKVNEELPTEVNGLVLPVDISKPNPNGQEFDNLYLDMNGIVHPCTHPEDKPAPANEDEAMVEIFNYLDRIMSMIRPRKLLYMAIDGVAPRAKMNQQRSRRFRAAQEAKILEDTKKELEDKNLKPVDKKEKFDSNCITPGTPFMARLSECLRYYIADKVNKDPGWRTIKIILSDASIPGEGEHKIMEFIRSQRVNPDHDPNTRHVLYGLDADLIMLGLATHEPYFSILREDVFAQEKIHLCAICGSRKHRANQCTGKSRDEEDQEKSVSGPKPFIFLHVNILREYLNFEMKVSQASVPFDLERAIDDWIFLCFFVGNDFLPHLPSLEIREGAIDTLIQIYKKNFHRMTGYLTENGSVHLERVQIMMDELGKMEDSIFRKRHEDEERRKENAKRREQQQHGRLNRQEFNNSTRDRMDEMGAFAVSVKDKEGLKTTNQVFVEKRDEIRKANKSAAEILKASLKQSKRSLNTEVSADTKKPRLESSETDTKIGATDVDVDKESAQSISESVEESHEDVVEESVEESVEDAVEVSVEDATDSSSNDEVVVIEEPEKKPEPKAPEEDLTDDVRLWEHGWRERYYKTKFDVELNNVEFRKKVVHAYTEGLCWVMQYYFQGCPSWKWFYPFHYSPFASDFSITDLSKELTIKFEKGAPFSPLEQLMSVLPAASQKHIPEPLRVLMTDSKSEIIDFYPEEFAIDLNGKKYAWQGVALLPFIEETRLLEAMKKIYSKLSEKDAALNIAGSDSLFVGENHALFEVFCDLYGKSRPKNPIELNTTLSGKLAGSVLPDLSAVMPGSTYYSPLIDYNMPDISNNVCISVLFFNPKLPSPSYVCSSKLLPGLQLPRKTLNSDDFYHVLNPRQNNRPSGHRHHGTHHVARTMDARYRNRNDQEDRPGYNRRDDHHGYQRREHHEHHRESRGYGRDYEDRERHQNRHHQHHQQQHHYQQQQQQHAPYYPNQYQQHHYNPYSQPSGGYNYPQYPEMPGQWSAYPQAAMYPQNHQMPMPPQDPSLYNQQLQQYGAGYNQPHNEAQNNPRPGGGSYAWNRQRDRQYQQRK